MRKDKVASINEAFDYMLDCTLATVCDLAQKKSRSNYEFRRQQNIAQSGIDWARSFDIPLTSRAWDVVNDCNGSVSLWAEQYDIRKGGL